MITLTGKSLRDRNKNPFLGFFNTIIYDQELSYGARIFALVCLDNPISKKTKFADLARRLGVSSSQVNKWKKDLMRRKYAFRVRRPV